MRDGRTWIHFQSEGQVSLLQKEWHAIFGRETCESFIEHRILSDVSESEVSGSRELMDIGHGKNEYIMEVADNGITFHPVDCAHASITLGKSEARILQLHRSSFFERVARQNSFVPMNKKNGFDLYEVGQREVDGQKILLIVCFSRFSLESTMVIEYLNALTESFAVVIVAVPHVDDVPANLLQHGKLRFVDLPHDGNFKIQREEYCKPLYGFSAKGASEVYREKVVIDERSQRIYFSGKNLGLTPGSQEHSYLMALLSKPGTEFEADVFTSDYLKYQDSIGKGHAETRSAHLSGVRKRLRERFRELFVDTRELEAICAIFTDGQPRMKVVGRIDPENILRWNFPQN